MGDGGGVKQAVSRPIVGADKVARLLAAGLGRVRARMSVERANVNAGPALIVRLDGEIDGVLALRVEDRRVSGMYYVRNPEKLSWLDEETAFSR